MKRRFSPKVAKIHRAYTFDEAAGLYGVHRNTVRGWVREGLPTIDQRRPVMILGRELAAFHSKRREKNKRPCGPGQFYCMRCKAPRNPAGARAEYRPLTPRAGTLVGICTNCGTKMFRRVSLANLEVARGEVVVAIPMLGAEVDAGGAGGAPAAAAGQADAPSSPKEKLVAALLAGADPDEAFAEYRLSASAASSRSALTSGNPTLTDRTAADGDEEPVSAHGVVEGYAA